MEAKPPKVLAGIPVPKFREFRRDPCPAALPEVPLLMSKGIFGRFQPGIPRMDPGFYSRKKKERQEFSQRVKAGNFLGFFFGIFQRGEGKKGPEFQDFSLWRSSWNFFGIFFLSFSWFFPRVFWVFFHEFRGSGWSWRGGWELSQSRGFSAPRSWNFIREFPKFHRQNSQISSKKFLNSNPEIPEFHPGFFPNPRQEQLPKSFPLEFRAIPSERIR